MATQENLHTETVVQPARRRTSDVANEVESNDVGAPEYKARFRQMLDAGKARASEWKGGFEDGIRAKPVQSILIAAAVGAVIGVLVGRRSR
ncbi:MAG: hypothetical protein IT453_10320 [Planctomycetes bacterium]|nr:hypothetical protein [Planctomycetota bacterium]